MDVAALVRAQDRAHADAIRAERAVVGLLTDPRGWRVLAADPGGAARANASFAVEDALPTDIHPGEVGVPRWVDVYVSAGPVDAGGSCDTDNTATCRLYRVRLDLSGGNEPSVTQLTARDEGAHTRSCGAGPGDIQPALAPDESRLAWVRKCTGAESWNELLTQGYGEAEPTMRVHAGDARHRPEFPEWLTTDGIAYHTKNPGEDGESHDDNVGTVWWSGPDASAPLLGPGGFDPDHGYADIDYHPAPGYRADGQPRIVTHGGELPHDGIPAQRVPRVTTIVGTEVEAFELGFSGDDNGPAECHHAAWNITGDRILCHRAHPGEDYPDERAILHMLYEYRFDPATTSWKQTTRHGGRSFDTTSPADIPPEDVPGVAESDCTQYYFKYGQWCGTNNHVLATLFCTNNLGQVLASRVLLLRTDGPSTRYCDVTRIIERATGVPEGTLRGIFGTCSSIHDAPHWRPAA